MTRSLTKCQFVAFFAGVLLCFTLYGEATLAHKLGGSRAQPSLLTLGGSLILLLVQPAFFAFLVARYAGRRDGVALLTTAVPCMTALAGIFVSETDMHFAVAARHSMDSGSYGGVLMPGVLLLVWAWATAYAGIVLKRRREGTSEQAPAETGGSFLAFPAFLVAVAVGSVMWVQAHFANTWERNSPAGRVAAAREVLDSSTSTMDQRMKVLFDIQRLMREESAAEVLRKAMKEQPAPLNLLAAAGLAMHGDVAALPLLETGLMKSGELMYKGKQFRASGNLGHDLGWYTDPAAAPALGRLMKSEDPEVRRGAVQSLRNFHDPAAIEPLLLGLSDSDLENRWVSVMGLSEVLARLSGENESWHPGREEFRANEKMYLEHWKQWGETWRASH